VLVCVRGRVDLRDIMWLEGLGQIKKTNKLIGSRTNDFPACRIVRPVNEDNVIMKRPLRGTRNNRGRTWKGTRGGKYRNVMSNEVTNMYLRGKSVTRAAFCGCRLDININVRRSSK
jgi:hypothetical protein